MQTIKHVAYITLLADAWVARQISVSACTPCLTSFLHSTQAFTEHYYNTFDTNRQALGGLYQEQSLLTFEAQKFSGNAQILQKLTSLPFQQVKHQVTSLDAQPSVSQGINIFVTGQIIVSLPP